MHAQGKLENGTVFDSSVDRQPFSFQIGKHSVLPGVDAGVVGMWCASALGTPTACLSGRLVVH